jgi:hypothetical protein
VAAPAQRAPTMTTSKSTDGVATGTTLARRLTVANRPEPARSPTMDVRVPDRGLQEPVPRVAGHTGHHAAGPAFRRGFSASRRGISATTRAWAAVSGRRESWSGPGVGSTSLRTRATPALVARWRQVHPVGRRSASTGFLEGVSGGQTSWQGEVKIGTSDWRRTFAKRHSPASS